MTASQGLSSDDIDTVLRYADETRRESRLPRSEPPQPQDTVLDPTVALWRRLAVTHAAKRMPKDTHAAAASAGLQDSAPRAGQLCLHARVENIDPSAWEHRTLIQIWFRWADYIVPRADHALFSRGAMPRDPRRAAALERLADFVRDELDDGAPPCELKRRLHGLPVHATSATGRVAIRWDARTVAILAVDCPATDDEQARLLLAERFVHCYGPATSAQLAKWAGISRGDAVETWRQLDGLVPVATPNGRRWMFETDLDDATRQTPPTGVRLLPQGDPALYLDSPPAPAAPAVNGRVTQRIVNSLTGRVVVDGTIVGSWGRREGTVSLFSWAAPRHRVREVEQEAAAVAYALGKQPHIQWLSGGSTQ